MFLYLFVVFYTKSLALMLQYYISITKHSTVPVFIRYVLLCVPCILHTINITNVTISHITNQTLYRSLCLYGVFFYVFVIFYTQSLVLILQYHISTTKNSTVPVFIRYIILCSLYFAHNH